MEIVSHLAFRRVRHQADGWIDMTLTPKVPRNLGELLNIVLAAHLGRDRSFPDGNRHDGGERSCDGRFVGTRR